jgi:small-conductance mechanosensitive channel
MSGWIEVALWLSAAALIAAGFAGRLRPYRSFLWGSSALLLISSLLPRTGNALGQYLFGSTSKAPRLPSELFGIAWWALGAWLLNSVLGLVLRRTLFPRDDEPHARRLFADLASGVIYLIAFVGVIETVFRQPMSAVLATSGVLALVLGFALQSTLGDVLSGLAINIDRPFGAGDWIAVPPGIEGEVIEINWRSTRLRTWRSELIVIPNSVLAKSVVTNHSRLSRKHRCGLRIVVDQSIPPERVLQVLEEAGNASTLPPSKLDARAYAIDSIGSLISYELNFLVDEFASATSVRSAAIVRVVEALRRHAMPIGVVVTDVRILRPAQAADPQWRG